MKIVLSIAGTDAGVKAAESLKSLLLSTPLGGYEAGHLTYRFTFPAIDGQDPDGSWKCHVRGEWITGEWALAKVGLDENEAAGRWLRRVEIMEPLEPKIEVSVLHTGC